MAAAEQMLREFGGGADVISRGQMQAMFTGLAQAWRTNRSNGVASSSQASSSAGNSQQYPFDTSKLSAIEALGFSREHVLRVMGRMHAAGQNTKNLDLVTDQLLRDPQQDTPPDSLSLDRSSSERAELKKKVEQLTEAQEELRTCKICFDQPINCALQTCGHLCVCTTCAEPLKGKPCPICQRPIQNFLKVYWS